MPQGLQTLAALVILSLCASLVGLFFDKGNTSFATGIRTMVGGFFFGTVMSYLVHDSNFSTLLNRVLVVIAAMFAKPLYDKISSRIGTWLDMLVKSKIQSRNENNDQIPPP